MVARAPGSQGNTPSTRFLLRPTITRKDSGNLVQSAGEEELMGKRMKCAGFLLLAFFFAAAGAARAQDRVVIYGGSMEAREHGYQHGYRAGLRQGRADLTSNSSSNYESEDYRRADLGYEEYMGARPDFQRGYRDGYKEGYEDGYRNRPIRSEIYGLHDRYDPDRTPRNDDDARFYP